MPDNRSLILLRIPGRSTGTGAGATCCGSGGGDARAGACASGSTGGGAIGSVDGRPSTGGASETTCGASGTLTGASAGIPRARASVACLHPFGRPPIRARLPVRGRAGSPGFGAAQLTRESKCAVPHESPVSRDGVSLPTSPLRHPPQSDCRACQGGPMAAVGQAEGRPAERTLSGHPVGLANLFGVEL